MHISEGILAPQILAAGVVIAGAEVAWGLKKTDHDKIVQVAMASSVFFLASLINIRLGPSSTHLSLIGPIGLILGWSAFPAIFVALLLQAVLFQFGGILVLGVNTVSMATAAVAAHLIFGRPVRSGSLKIAASSAFAAGFLAVLLGASLVGMFLSLSDYGMLTAAKTLVAAHIPLGLIEGAAAAFMITFLKRTHPDVLGMAR
ncbi:MAG: cobalt transporter CbiM [Synergistaceae bacterium]|jgi:cobalt/nickel transport system permease protein|nr:cobalt transporter CbiM [Synergistaceae bacterium]